MAADSSILQPMADARRFSSFCSSDQKRIQCVPLKSTCKYDFYTVNMRDRLSKKNTLLPGGQIYVIRCFAYTLTEVAHGVIDSVRSAICKIRESIKFIKSCHSHEDKFSKLALQLQISSDKTLCLDITTQWNTTYLMLLAALDYMHALSVLEAFDDNYNQIPLAEDWKKVEVACKYLTQLYTSAHSIMSTEDPTANIFFHEAWRLQQEISVATAHEDTIISSIAKGMHERFDRYWKDCNVVLAIAVMMDPRFKMKIVEFSYSKIYGVKAAKFVKLVNDAAHELYKEYASALLPSTIACVEQGGVDIVPAKENKSPINPMSTDLEFDIYVLETSLSYSSKSELDQYMKEDLFPRNPEFDILKWWKLNSLKYPTLSRMARDVLAIPVSMVGSSSSVFTAGTEARMIDDYQKSLRPEIVEALFCAKDWFQHPSSVLESSSSSLPTNMQNELRS